MEEEENANIFREREEKKMFFSNENNSLTEVRKALEYYFELLKVTSC